MKRAGIVGLGLWLPSEVRRNDAWPDSFVRAFHEQREARRARDFTHIEQANPERPYDNLFVKHALPYDDDPFKGAVVRRVQAPEIPTVVGDAAAVRRALEDGGIEPREVDLILSSAVVPDRLAPSNGPAIQDLAGCVNAAGIGVEAFCSAALAQLDLAAGLVAAGRARVVVCVQSHQLARINDLDQPFSPIFGDAAAAFVVGEVPPDHGLVDLVRGGDGSLAGAVTHTFKGQPGAVWWKDASAPVCPGTEDPAAGRKIAQNALAYPIETIRELCTKTALPIDAIAALSMIQPLPWYQRAVADGLGVPIDRVPSTYASIAHVGAASVVANLLEARRRGLLRRGARVVLYAHGAGITRYAALLRWSHEVAS